MGAYLKLLVSKISIPFKTPYRTKTRHFHSPSPLTLNHFQIVTGFTIQIQPFTNHIQPYSINLLNCKVKFRVYTL